MEDEQEDRYMALKSGYISLRERLDEWTRQTSSTTTSEQISDDYYQDGHHIKENQSADDDDGGGGGGGGRRRIARRPVSGGQFATLQEFFQSKSRDLNQTGGNRNQHRPDQHLHPHHTRHKLPIMRLTKDDWNVRCWEERLSGKKRPPVGARSHFTGSSSGNNSGGARGSGSYLPGTRWISNDSSVKQTGERYQDNNNNSNQNGADNDDSTNTTTTTTNLGHPNRPRKPELQVEVFQQRVVDVETKLERIREGQPLDEQLHKLAAIKLGLEQRAGRSHSWTDQLKGELASGAHDRKVLQAKYKPAADAGQWSSPADRKHRSPLGRPIRRISQDDDDDDY